MQHMTHKIKYREKYAIQSCNYYQTAESKNHCSKPPSTDHHHHHHFICPIIQQHAHLHQYNWEEQDSKVQQEH